MTATASLFCKMCFDSGRSSFNTHNVKDSTGNVVCGYLLSLKCRNCGFSGHTVKYCKMSVAAAAVAVANRAKTYKPVEKPRTVIAVTNSFALLCDEEVEEVEKVEKVEKVGDVREIVWGVGTKSMIGRSWADVCCV